MQLKALREAAGFTQEELATIAGLSVHAISALERGERRRPQVDTVRALSAALDLTGAAREAFLASARATSPDPAVDERRGTALPVSPTYLLGRDDDVQILGLWLMEPGLRLVTLTGPGGAGKTRLALELARGCADRGMRVIYVPLAALSDAAFVAPAIAETLGLADVPAEELARRARATCDDQPTLLVLDNFEHVLPAAALVADLLTSVASFRILVTSRAALRLRGEREYPVGPLALEAGSHETSPADLVRSPAVRLFVERVRDVRPDFRLTPGNGPTVSAICRRLDGLPLALELAAPWIKALTVETLLARLEQDVLRWTSGPRDLPERQQTMNGTVAWSYRLLSPDEQRAFRRFGALPGLFPIDAAAAVLGGRAHGAVGEDEALVAIASLMDKSLLLRAPTSVVATCPLYQMLETVRAYAALELTASGERDDAMEGLVRYAAAEAALAADGLVGASQVEFLDRVREDLESYRGALTWLIGKGRGVEAADIAWSLLFFWVIRGHGGEGLRWYEKIGALPSLPGDAASKMLVGAGTMYYTQGELTKARSALMSALVLTRDVGDANVSMQAENLLGHVELASGNVDAARERFTGAVAGFKTTSVAWGAGHAMSALAWVALSSGDGAVSDRLLDDASASLQAAGPWFLTLSLYVRAVLAVRRGSLDEAVGFVHDCLTRVRALHDRFAFVYALVPLAAVAVMRGDDAWAARILGIRDAVSERSGATVVDKSVHDLTARTAQEVRARLGDDRWAQAYSLGRRTSIDALLEEIDRSRA